MQHYHLRKAEKQCGGAHKEESGCRHWDIAGGSQGSAGWDHAVGKGRRGWTPPTALAAATWHHFLYMMRRVVAAATPKDLSK